jgi:hypothetical protein
MSVVLSVDPKGRFAVLTIIDPYTIDEWRSAMVTLLEHPVYLERGAVLVDRRQCMAPDAPFVAEMHQFFTRRQRDASRMMAAVVVGDDADLEMGRTTERANSDGTIRTFSNYVEAERWLTTQTARR